jgi:cold-inducible RNA-binding protein
MGVRLFIGNLPYDTTDAELRDHFSSIGRLTQVFLPVDRDTGRPRGFAFVEFESAALATQAIDKFNNQPFKGRPLAVKEAQARGSAPGPSGGGGGAGGGGYAPRPPMAPRMPPRFDLPPAFDPGGRNSRFGPDAPRKGKGPNRAKKDEKKREGPIREKNTGRLYSTDDAGDDDLSPDLDIDDFATSAPRKDEEDDDQG